jgi:prepilin-type N-terminal cleavage/methylation domain-containing protein
MIDTKMMRILRIATNRGFTRTPTLPSGLSSTESAREKLVCGFTLVETLVAIGILSLSLAATFTAAQKGLQDSTFAKDQITAGYLTQDAVEYIKNIRDENTLWSLNSVATGGASRDWLTGLSDKCPFDKTCTIDVPLKVVTVCSGTWGSCPNIQHDTVSGLFGYTGSWTQTNFKREIQFHSISANEALATVSVSWTSGTFSKTIRVTEDLFNQQ